VRLGVGDRVTDCQVHRLDVNVVLEDYDTLVCCGIRRRRGVGELRGGVENGLERGLIGYRLDSSGVDAPV
jgi:hypothetical protein